MSEKNPILTPTRIAVLAGTGYILKKLHDEIKRKEREPGATQKDVDNIRDKGTSRVANLSGINSGTFS